MLSFFLLAQILSFIYAGKADVISEGKFSNVVQQKQQKIQVVTYYVLFLFFLSCTSTDTDVLKTLIWAS